jgi:SAM-dependent methyltransferase
MSHDPDLNRGDGRMTEPAPSNWWETLYDDMVADVLLRRKDDSEIRATISFLRDHLDLHPGDRVFDQCCGIGVLALPLARAGFPVVGVDAAEGYVEEARRRASAEGLAGEFFAADACIFVAPTTCTAAFNWDTGFGNAGDAGNLHMLRRAFETLRPGGWFALDYQHIPRILARFQNSLVSHHAGAQGEITLVRESRVDLGEGALRQQWTFFLPDGRRIVRQTAIRLYLPHVLGAMLRECGFVDVRYHGGVRGEALSLDSPRCIVLARRPVP